METKTQTTPRDLTKWRREIAILEQQCAVKDACIREAELYLANMRDKQVNRLAELRLQRMLLQKAESPQPATT